MPCRISPGWSRKDTSCEGRPPITCGTGFTSCALLSQRVQYRILYFFHGSEAVVISHGLTKEGKVPGAEIERAIERMARFRANPPKHSFIRAKGE
jgi:phage-related protein